MQKNLFPSFEADFSHKKKIDPMDQSSLHIILLSFLPSLDGTHFESEWCLMHVLF